MPSTLRNAFAVVAASSVTSPFALALLQSPPPEQSSPFSYTYAEVTAFMTDLDGISDDLEGFGLGGSYALDHQFYVFATAATGEVDVSGVGDVDGDSVALGAGFHTPLAEGTDFFAELAYLHVELDLAGTDDSDDGWSVTGGIRHWIVERVELSGGVGYVDVGDGEIGFAAGGRFHFTERVSLGAGFGILDDDETLSLGLRLQF